MLKKSSFISTRLIALLISFQFFAIPANAFDQSEAYLRAHYPSAPAQGFAAKCPGGITYGWLSGVFLEFPGSDIGDVEGEKPQPAPTRIGYYVGAYQYEKIRAKHERHDGILFCYDKDLRPGHPATIINAWIIPATSSLKTCIITESSKRLACSQ